MGSNSQLSLWYDKWMDKGSLRSLIAGPLNRGEEGMLLREVVNLSGWNWQKISFSLPRKLTLEMKATPVSMSTSNSDCISWASSPNGLFDLKEAYKLASLEIGDAITGVTNGEWLWKVDTIPKIKFFLWQCFHHIIPICATLATRGMDVPQICPLCIEGPETILHSLRDCREAQVFWKASPPYG